MYTYMTPSQVWYAKKALIGKSIVDAYWCRWGDCEGRDPRMFKFRFKTLRTVEIGPHAYTLVFTDGTRGELISYDTVCVYTVDLNKS